MLNQPIAANIISHENAEELFQIWCNWDWMAVSIIGVATKSNFFTICATTLHCQILHATLYHANLSVPVHLESEETIFSQKTVPAY